MVKVAKVEPKVIVLAVLGLLVRLRSYLLPMELCSIALPLEMTMVTKTTTTTTTSPPRPRAALGPTEAVAVGKVEDVVAAAGAEEAGDMEDGVEVEPAAAAAVGGVVVAMAEKRARRPRMKRSNSTELPAGSRSNPTVR